MSYCLNPICQKPQNPDSLETCRNCGARLLLKERYRPIKPIAQGGFGRTFLAIDEDKPSKPRCVIKQFLPSTQETRHIKKAADLFEQEALRLEELGSHPQIPALLAHFSQDGRQYLVQEFIHGKTLSELLHDRGNFTEAQVWEVLTSLLPVLEFIHSHGVIHRDVKPSNIILTPGNRAGSRQGRNSQPDWGAMLQALSMETAQGFRDFVSNRQRFSQVLGDSLSKPPKNMAIADYSRWQQIASLVATYPEMPPSQRQFLVADTSRLLYEMRRKYEVNGQAAGQMVLVDFGAAKAAVGTALVKTGTTIGSPEYLAPEQSRGKAVFASDLYSLGVTCVHLLTGRSPFDLFDADHNLWVWRRYLTSPIGDRLSRVLDRLLEPGLRQRYPSAAAALQDLEPMPIPLSVPVLPLPVNGLPPVLRRSPRATSPPALRVEPLKKPPPAAPTKPPHPEGRRRLSRGSRGTSDWECVQQLFNPGKVAAIVLHPTIPLLVSTSGTTIKLWDTQTGQLTRTLTGHLDVVDCLALSPDGQTLISGSTDKSIRLWSLPGGDRIGTLNLHSDTVASLALSPNGRFLASGSLRDPIQLWDLQRQQTGGELTGHTGRIDTLTFSPDGKWLAAAGGDATIVLWEPRQGNLVKILKGHSQAIAALAFSPDSKTLASASWDGNVKLWSTTNWREKRTLSFNSNRVQALLFSPDGKFLLTGSDTLHLWNPRSGKAITPLTGQTGIAAIAIDASGKTIASASWDGEIRLWQKK